MAYDSADGYIVLFGGLNATNLTNQTWKYVRGTWTQLHPKTSPPARAGGMMAYDVRDREVVLFGGLGCPWWFTGFCNDTWTFAGGQWTNATGTTGAATPGALAYGSMTYDPQLGKVLLFGGYYDPCGCVDWTNTWVFAFAKGAWTVSHKSGSLSLRLPGNGASIAYDSKDRYVVEFGGTNSATANATTWKYSSHHWTRLYPSTSPSWRFEPRLVFDPKLGHLILFGGSRLPNGTNDSNATWEFVGGSWSLLHPSQSPPAEGDYSQAAYDAADGYLILFGGHNAGSGGLSNDTWVYR